MSHAHARSTILVVDDEPFIAQLIADVLTAEGYAVDTASGGLAALERIGRRAYDLVLSDLRMPELDGLGLYRELERRCPDLARRFVFITGTTEHTDYHDLIQGVAAPVLTKPFDLLELQRVAREMLLASVPEP
jgi:two-component system NtrC family sensor kinase